MDADRAAFYAEELRNAVAAVEAARKAETDAKAAAKQATQEALDYRDAVVWSAVNVGKMPQTTVADHTGLTTRTIRRLTEDAALGNTIITPDTARRKDEI